MWELDHKEGWALKNWCFWTVVLEKTLESPLDCKEIQPVNLCINPSDAKSQLIGNNPGTGKDWGQEEREVTEDEMVRWRHWLNGHEFDQTPGYSEGQGSLACCSPWVARSWTWLSNWTTTYVDKDTFTNSIFIRIFWDRFYWICFIYKQIALSGWHVVKHLVNSKNGIESLIYWLDSRTLYYFYKPPPIFFCFSLYHYFLVYFVAFSTW